MNDSNITIPIAFLAGLLSFLSPCVLPLVPGYVSLISGVSIDRLKGEGGTRASALRAVIANSLAFNVGLSIIFVGFGATAGFLGTYFFNNIWVRMIGGLVIVLFGLQLIGLLKITALYKDTRFFSQQKPRGMLGSLTLGMAFAAGWTPCIGPILGGIIGLAATSGGWRSGLILSAFYAAGLAVPFLLTGLSINQFLGFYGKFRKHLHKVEVVSGFILILIGLAVAFNYTSRMSSVLAWLPNAEALLKGKSRAIATTPQQAASNRASYEMAPDVELLTLDGRTVHLSEMRGQIVLLNFWATWCGPCRAEIPEFNAMQRDHGAQGLKIVGVSSSDTPDDVKKFQDEIKQEYTITLASTDVPTKFGNGPGLPITIIIDREGRIRQRIIGGTVRDALEAVIKPLLDEQKTGD
ncbi:MAG TPA: cytochrome c biogenesis protein CcdA [Pyrinomonadaceae bacterium]|nr:cytochrome c biogenesis protein CcdA [Pyrinomonadaceae bacterium]